MLSWLVKPCAVLLLLLGTVSTAFGSPSTTLLIVGDSLSAGYGVPPGEEWVALLTQKISAAGLSVKVVNASISGDTTASGRSRLPKLLQEHQPKWVVLELGANDGLRGLSLAVTEQNLDSMINAAIAAQAKPLLIGMKIPPNYGTKYIERFEQIYADLAQRYQIPLLPFLLAEVATNPELMQADRMHPNAKAQPIIAENVWAFLKPQIMKLDSVTWP